MTKIIVAFRAFAKSLKNFSLYLYFGRFFPRPYLITSELVTGKVEAVYRVFQSFLYFQNVKRLHDTCFILRKVIPVVRVKLIYVESSQ